MQKSLCSFLSTISSGEMYFRLCLSMYSAVCDRFTVPDIPQKSEASATPSLSCPLVWVPATASE